MRFLLSATLLLSGCGDDGPGRFMGNSASNGQPGDGQLVLRDGTVCQSTWVTENFLSAQLYCVEVCGCSPGGDWGAGVVRLNGSCPYSFLRGWESETDCLRSLCYSSVVDRDASCQDAVLSATVGCVEDPYSECRSVADVRSECILGAYNINVNCEPPPNSECYP